MRERNPVVAQWAVFAIFSAVFFFLNHRHTAEADVFAFSVQLGKSLLAGNGYMVDGEASFYPLWGYPIFTMLAGFSPEVVLAFQWALCLAGWAAFYRAFRIVPMLWHLPLFIPYVAVCSVKWPNAVNAALVMLILAALRECREGGGRLPLAIGGTAAGLAVTMRPEAWLIGFAVSGAALIASRRSGMAPLKFGAVVFICQALFIAPWALRAHQLTGEWLFASSNGGHVAYISLGELPDNPWGLSGADRDGVEYVSVAGIKSPFSPEGNRALKKRFKELVAGEPAAFASKVGHNARRELTHGVFTGQLFTLAVSDSGYAAFMEKRRASGIMAALGEQGPKARAALAVYLLLDYCFRFVWLALLTAVFVLAVRQFRNESLTAEMLVVSVLCVGVLLQAAFLQYQPRHMNIVWAPLFGASLSMWNIRQPSKAKDAG